MSQRDHIFDIQVPAEVFFDDPDVASRWISAITTWFHGNTARGETELRLLLTTQDSMSVVGTLDLLNAWARFYPVKTAEQRPFITIQSYSQPKVLLRARDQKIYHFVTDNNNRCQLEALEGLELRHFGGRSAARLFYDPSDGPAKLFATCFMQGHAAVTTSVHSFQSLHHKIDRQRDAIDVVLIGIKKSLQSLEEYARDIEEWTPRFMVVGPDADSLLPHLPTERTVRAKDQTDAVRCLQRLLQPEAEDFPVIASASLVSQPSESVASPVVVRAPSTHQPILSHHDGAFAKPHRLPPLKDIDPIHVAASPADPSSDSRLPAAPTGKRLRRWAAIVGAVGIAIAALSVVVVLVVRRHSTHRPVSTISGSPSSASLRARVDLPNATPTAPTLECHTINDAQWSRLRSLEVWELASNARQPGTLARGRRFSLGNFARLNLPEGRPALVVLGQTTCTACMEELGALGMEAQLHVDDARISSVLLETEWRAEHESTPYMAQDYARRIALSGAPVAVASLPDDTDFSSLLGEGVAFPAFLYLEANGLPTNLCIGSIIQQTPAGQEFKRWINRASLRIPARETVGDPPARRR